MRRGGSILMVVLIVTALAAAAAAALMYRMRAEVTAAGAGARDAEQAYSTALSGVQYAINLLETVGPTDWEFFHDNPDVFKNQLVVADGANQWFFTIYADVPPNPDGASEEKVVRFGLTDQAGKINLNYADAETLIGLPGMTNELVDCLIDFRDRDDDPRPNGAEQEYYDQLQTPYAIKNGPLITLEEVMLVKGFNGRIVYGEDANQNGMMEANEDDGQETFPPDDADGVLNTGLRTTATAISYEKDVDSEGKARLNLNAGSRALGRAGLSRQTLEFIDAYLAEGQKFKHPSELLEMEFQTSKRQGRRPAGAVLRSGVGARELPTVMDKLTCGAGGRMPLMGLVNVNTAPPAVLGALGFNDDQVSGIISARSGEGALAGEDRRTTAWLYTEGIVDVETFKQIAPKLTARGFQYHVRCVGFGEPCGRYRIIEAVVDLGLGKPRITYLRDITRLGLPFPLSSEEKEYSN